MSMFTLAISCFTISNLPWFLDLTFQVPMQYCSLQAHTLLLSPVTSYNCFYFYFFFLFFDSVSSFFLELYLHCSPVAYGAPTDLRSSSFGVLSFCLFILFMGNFHSVHWSVLPFLSPGDFSVPGIKSGSLALQADSLPSEPSGKPWVAEVPVIL